MGLEDELRREMEQAVERDPAMLRGRTGVGSQEVSTHEEFDLCWTAIGAWKQAILRLARELDERGGGG